ncbi:MAG: PPC domain-containing protein [Gemmatimonadaceae bacterium]
MTHRTVLRFFTAVALAGLAVGCGKDTPVTADGPFLEIDPLFTGVDQGGTQQLNASFAGQPATVTWETSDATIAMVSPAGVVSGIKPGTAAATATLTSDPTKKRSASITVTAVVGTRLTSGVAVTGLSSSTDGETATYNIFVPPGSTSLSVVLSGGTGDADIFVQKSTPPPTTSKATCASQGPDTNETCTIAAPASGTWYIVVQSFVYFGATLTATVSP